MSSTDWPATKKNHSYLQSKTNSRIEFCSGSEFNGRVKAKKYLFEKSPKDSEFIWASHFRNTLSCVGFIVPFSSIIGLAIPTYKVPGIHAPELVGARFEPYPSAFSLIMSLAWKGTFPTFVGLTTRSDLWAEYFW